MYVCTYVPGKICPRAVRPVSFVIVLKVKCPGPFRHIVCPFCKSVIKSLFQFAIGADKRKCNVYIIGICDFRYYFPSLPFLAGGGACWMYLHISAVCIGNIEALGVCVSYRACVLLSKRARVVGRD